MVSLKSIVLIALSSCLIAAKVARAEKEIPSSASKSATVDESKKPVILTTRNFGEHVGDGNVWLVEFYSPHCIHCTQFAPTYDEIADEFHSSTSHTVKVGKVDGNMEKALASRFNIYGYPSFFIIDGYKVYPFEQPRSKQNMMQFAEGGYKKIEPLPFYSSPMGPIGILQGSLINFGVKALDVFAWSQTRFGLSPLFAASVLFGAMFMGIFLLIVFLAIAIPPKLKEH
jgi:thiol-disulfide isomerase/thioredoxin